MELLAFPAELRSQIYTHLLAPSSCRILPADPDDTTTYSYAILSSLSLVSHQIRAEALSTFHALNAFAAIETPWQEALPKVQSEGHVPIVSKAPALFPHWSLLAAISVPDFPMPPTAPARFVVHADDLPAFCATWRYSDLSEPGLNAHLRLDLTLRDPRGGAVGRARQRRLLLPFGAVKGLREAAVGGAEGAVEAELRGAMAAPHESAESCLRRATGAKDEGNVALREGRFGDALERYRRAWEAIHIVVRGRERTVHADAFFDRWLEEEPYAGKRGLEVRLGVRVKLVANTVALYNKMERWDDALFWGMRTISTVRLSMGLPDDRAAERPEMEAFLATGMSDDMGKIYYRTAVACRELGKTLEARQLLRVAHVYLPRDKTVAQALAGVAPRLG